MSDDPGESWAAWLREQFDSHPRIRTNADLVRAGGNKPNGRPVIDASTVTQWLRGRPPSYRLAVATADAFGVDIASALAAAGYIGAVEQQDEDQRPRTTGDPIRQAIVESDLPVAIKRTLLANYEALLELAESDELAGSRETSA